MELPSKDQAVRSDTRQLISYGLIAIPLAAIGLPFAVFMPKFYAVDLKLGLDVTGALFMIARLWDMITDPIMGVLIDRFPSRFGRVTHWMVLSLPILMVSGYFLYMPPRDGVSSWYLLGWILVLYAGFTMLQTPHQAWVTTLAQSYDDRSRYFMWREVFGSISLLSLLALPAILENAMALDIFGQTQIMGLVLLVSLPICTAWAIWRVPDASIAPQKDPALTANAWSVVKQIAKNEALIRVVIIEICIGLAIASTGATYLFAAEWGFGVENGASAMLMLFFLSGLLSMPLWMKLSEVTDKHRTLTWLCILAFVAHVSYIPLSWVGGYAALAVAVVVSGVGFGAPAALARSMIADIVEQDLLQTHRDRSGVFFALMTSAFKTGQSFAIGVPFVLLGLIAGFDPAGENGPAEIRNLMIVFAGLPALAYLVAAMVSRKYPLTRSYMASLKQASEPNYKG